MTALIFSSEVTGRRLEMQTAMPLRITGGAVACGPLVLAKYARDSWYVGRTAYEHLAIRDSLRIRVDERGDGQIYGPFEEIVLEANAVSSAAGVLARYDALEEAWYFDRHGSRCDVLILEAHSCSGAGATAAP